VHDGGFGCEPVLPAEPCPPGLMAVPGDAECRAIMPCGEGRWGDIPVDGATLYVDAAHAGSSDGSEAQPFTTITEALAAAPPNGLVAVAAGQYLEDVDVSGKPVRLWGRCPDQVEVVGTGGEIGTLVIRSGASGTEVHGLAVGGPAVGVAVSDATDVLVSGMWIRQNALRGVLIQDSLGPAAVTIAGSLVEQNTDIGVYTGGSQVTVDGSVIRATQPRPSDQLGGRGLSVQLACNQTDCFPEARSSGVVRGSVVEQNYEVGLFVGSSDLTVDGTVVRTTLPQVADLRFGRGISVVPYCVPPGVCDPVSRPTATIVGSLVAGSTEAGVNVQGTDLYLERTVVRTTASRASDGLYGRGLVLQVGCDSVGGCDPTARSQATILSSLVHGSQDVGLVVVGSDATITSSVVAATTPRTADALFGDGFAVVSDLAPASAVLTASLVDDSARAGVASFGAAMTMTSTAVRCAAFALSGEDLADQPFEFVDGGDNACGCPDLADTCKLVSVGLEPPAAPGL